MKRIYQLKTVNCPVILKDIDGKKGIMTGYFSHFDNVDAHGDIIRFGAYRKTISEIGPGSAMPRIKHLLNHDTTKPIGKLITLKEDPQANGLYYESQVGTHKLGKDVIDMAESGLISEHSVAIYPIPEKTRQLQSWEHYKANPSKGLQEILEVKMFEGSSLTAWGANEMTPLTGIKSAEQIEIYRERIERLEKFCRNSEASDDIIQLLLIECRQLTQLLIDATKPENKSTLPDNTAKVAAETIQQFIKQNFKQN